MCERITFPVLWIMCDSQRDEALWATRTIQPVLLLAAKTKQNISDWAKYAFVGEACCCLITFVSRVQMSHVII